jgi:RNA polymerase sigma factor (sigma-70 family)
MRSVAPSRQDEVLCSTRSDALELARQAADGDTRATKRLLEKVAPRVVRAVRAVLGAGDPEVEDAAQLSLIGFIQALPSFRGESDPSFFAARIAVRTASAVRRKRRVRQMGQDASVEVDTLEGDPIDLAAARRRVAVRALLDELPEEQSEALALRFMLGWSLADIAHASSAPLNTVRSRIRLAKEALRRHIKGDPGLAEEFNPLGSEE